MKIKKEFIKESKIIYIRRIGKYGEENYILMNKMKEWIKNNGLWGKDGIIYGIAQDNPSITPHESCRYDVCFVTNDDFNDSSINKGVLSQGYYIVFTIEHTAEAVSNFWSKFMDIIREKNYLIDNTRPIMERYKFSMIEKNMCEFCVPIICD